MPIELWRLSVAWTAAFTLALIAAMPIHAQSVTANGQVPITDVSGPIVTTGDMVSGMYAGSPGPVHSFTCAVAMGVRREGMALLSELTEGRLWVVIRDQDGRIASATTDLVPLGSERQPHRLAAALQDDLLGVLTRRTELDAATDDLVAGLTSAPNASSRARRSAVDLLDSMGGLLLVIERMDPQDPGHEAATLLTVAVSRYNAFINASSEAFLQDAPDELLAIETVLSRIVAAAFANDGNDDDACE